MAALLTDPIILFAALCGASPVLVIWAVGHALRNRILRGEG